ncbi:hypothetical protein FACS189421_13200 [Bacteroidia bacterium]|nr:hypothetical protein FACS189421_13200 [Bacteroidia bacterium]
MAHAADMSMQIQMLDYEIAELYESNKQDMESLNKCAHDVKNFKIAGITTLSLTAAGAVLNIIQHNKLKKLSGQISELRVKEAVVMRDVRIKNYNQALTKNLALIETMTDTKCRDNFIRYIDDINDLKPAAENITDVAILDKLFIGYDTDDMKRQYEECVNPPQEILMSNEYKSNDKDDINIDDEVPEVTEIKVVQVSGTITNTTGDALIGVAVASAADASVETTTDENGKYIIKNLPVGSALTVAYMGYNAMTSQTFDSNAEYNVSLTADSAMIAENKIPPLLSYELLKIEIPQVETPSIKQPALAKSPPKIEISQEQLATDLDMKQGILDRLKTDDYIAEQNKVAVEEEKTEKANAEKKAEATEPEKKNIPTTPYVQGNFDLSDLIANAKDRESRGIPRTHIYLDVDYSPTIGYGCHIDQEHMFNRLEWYGPDGRALEPGQVKEFYTAIMEYVKKCKNHTINCPKGWTPDKRNEIKDQVKLSSGVASNQISATEASIDDELKARLLGQIPVLTRKFKCFNKFPYGPQYALIDINFSVGESAYFPYQGNPPKFPKLIEYVTAQNWELAADESSVSTDPQKYNDWRKRQFLSGVGAPKTCQN